MENSIILRILQIFLKHSVQWFNLVTSHWAPTLGATGHLLIRWVCRGGKLPRTQDGQYLTPISCPRNFWNEREDAMNLKIARYYYENKLSLENGARYISIASVQFSSVTQSCPTLCDPMNCSKPGLPVQHQLPEFTQTHVHRVGDAIQPSHPLSSPSSPAPNPSQHQSLFQWVNSSHEVAKVLEF